MPSVNRNLRMSHSPEPISLPGAIADYLGSRPRAERWLEWLRGRRYRLATFPDRLYPVYAIAYQFNDAERAETLAHAIEKDWAEVPETCRIAYSQILPLAPRLIVVQLKRKNLCGCLGHRHPAVREGLFAPPQDLLLGCGHAGEVDIAFEQIKAWHALPLSDTALDSKFLDGSRLDDFHAEQFRLRLLSVLLHETNHLADLHEPESSVRGRSIEFYRQALASYTENAVATLSLTIDRSFSRLG